MRSATANDYYRRLEQKSSVWKTKVLELTFDGIPGLGSQKILFEAPVSVLCGPNGVGKSTLLNAIWATLDPISAMKHELNAVRLNTGTATLLIEKDGEQFTKQFNFLNNTAEDMNDFFSEVVHVDSALDVGRLQNFFISRHKSKDLSIVQSVDPAEITEGEASRILNEKETGYINYLLGRNYSKVTVTEIEFADEIVPFFEVNINDIVYDSRTMGSGEFASFLLWWRLDRARIGSIILFEEPETYLSPKARTAFLDVLLKHAFEKQICVILTSHSGEVITPLPEKSIKFFTRHGGNIRIFTGELAPSLLSTIGVDVRKDILVFVEDIAAKLFTQLIFNMLYQASLSVTHAG